MKLVQYYSLVQTQLDGHFTTAQLAAASDASLSATSKALAALESLELIVNVGHGRWVDPKRVRRLALPEFLSNSPTYVTAHSGLFQHGMIDQIPTGIYAATTGRGGNFPTPYGPIYLYHLLPELFTGWSTNPRSPGAKIASPEKSLVDYFYFRMTGDPAFGRLPELELPTSFSWRQAKKFAAAIRNPIWRRAVRTCLDGQEEISQLPRSKEMYA